MSNHPTTTLAESQLTRSPHNTITVELVEDDNMPPIVRVVWPLNSTLIDPKRFPDTAAAIAQLFARAHIVLAGLKAHGL